MRFFGLAIFILTALTFGFHSSARAVDDTDFVITVKARDAKFIGATAGGARVTIRDRRTDEIIASGVAYGDSGDTAAIMTDGYKRDAVMTSQGMAKFQFSTTFWEPTPVTVSATAPLGQPQSMVTVSEDMILLPGKDYTSDNGIMLELPGFAVDVVSPLPGQTFKLNPDLPVTVEANVMKLSGDRIAMNTPWSPERYTVEVHVYRDNLLISSVEIPYSGEPGIYNTNIRIPVAGTYRFTVTAFDQKTKEAGMDSTTIVITKE